MWKCLFICDLFLPISYARKSAEKHLAPLLRDVSLWVFPPKTSIVPLSSTAEWRYRAKPLSLRINLRAHTNTHPHRVGLISNVRHVRKASICQLCVCLRDMCVHRCMYCNWWRLSQVVTWPVETALHANCSFTGAPHTHTPHTHSPDIVGGLSLWCPISLRSKVVK